MKRYVALSVGAASSIFACATLADFDVLHPVDVDAGSAVKPDVDTNDGGCVLDRWPDPPDANPSGAGAQIVSAMRWLSINDDVDAASPLARGFDLDGVCGPSCTSGASNVQVDGPGGVDDEGNKFAQFATRYTSNGSASGYIQRGDVGVLVGVTDLDDLLDDPDVGVTVGTSRGVEPLAPDGGTPNVPKFDGTDVFATSVVGARRARVAYVRGGKLVARFDLLELPFGGSRIELRGAVLVANVIASGAPTLADGRIVGRWAASDLLLAGATQRVDGGVICGATEPIYQELKSRLCTVVDLGADPAADGTNPPCAALSVALRFEVAPANLGERRDIDPPLRPCGATWTDQCPPPGGTQ